MGKRRLKKTTTTTKKKTITATKKAHRKLNVTKNQSVLRSFSVSINFNKPGRRISAFIESKIIYFYKGIDSWGKSKFGFKRKRLKNW